MGSQSEFVLIDTNIFVIDLRYKRDVHYNKNSEFLTLMAQNGKGLTTVVNLLELCGILSFNLSERQLYELWFCFADKYNITVFPGADIRSDFPNLKVNEIFELLKKRTSFGDALMIALAKKYLPFVPTMVTWDSGHFKNKFPGTILTPEEFLER
ncbi:type II toxin-antitoxin system VapC family toxin [Desulfonema magnum]|uniref:PIN domain-containing protein n=1 Tax=Desulfonema magnum TaxID=45655 RepID=A0A975GTB9_9BACT|nr:type II toxin-antitoxin system VapC family toxin [Desulfonema magnum]QTA91978.1 PIN domain-containing protein [Desulfonema magnum]